MTNYSIAISGKTFYAALDQLATGAHDEGLIDVGSRKVGKGRQYLYELDRPHLIALKNRLIDVGVSFLDSDDQDTRNEGRSCLKDARRVEALLASIPEGES